MITIWKYDLQVDDVVDVEMQENAILLHAGSQRPRVDPGVVSVWAMVDTDAPIAIRRFRIAGTGHEFSQPDYAHGRYVGTAIAANGELVWHVFDLGEDVPAPVPPTQSAAVEEEPRQPLPVDKRIHPDDLPGVKP